MKSFRFGVALSTLTSRDQWQTAVRRVEDFGYDTLHLPDHLGMPAPFPALQAAAECSNMRVGPYVLNAAFYTPALLAREVAALDLLTDHRLELGLGAGFVRDEFEAAGLPFPTAGHRVDHLARTTAYLREHVPGTPIMIAGSGDRVLSLAAAQADIVGLSGARTNNTAPDALGDVVGFIRDKAGSRFDELELNLVITAVPHDRDGIPKRLRSQGAGPTDQQLRELPTELSGSPAAMADTLRHYRETYAITYFSVPQLHAEAFSKVIAELR